MALKTNIMNVDVMIRDFADRDNDINRIDATHDIDTTFFISYKVYPIAIILQNICKKLKRNK